jgi:hypothetical protein
MFADNLAHALFRERVRAITSFSENIPKAMSTAMNAPIKLSPAMKPARGVRCLIPPR